MRVKFMCSDKDAVDKFPIVTEITEFNVDDESHQIYLEKLDDNNLYISDRAISFLETDKIDHIYNELLTVGYADLTEFGNFTREEDDDE